MGLTEVQQGGAGAEKKGRSQVAQVEQEDCSVLVKLRNAEN